MSLMRKEKEEKEREVTEASGKDRTWGQDCRGVLRELAKTAPSSQDSLSSPLTCLSPGARVRNIAIQCKEI